MFHLNITAKFLQSLIWLSGNPNNLALERVYLHYLQILHCVKSQNSTDLMYNVVEG